MRDPANLMYASAASTCEIAIKAALGRISVDPSDVVHAIGAAGFDELAVTIAHTLRIRRLPPHHRDPFDRLLVAQAIEEGLTIVTHDRAFASYPAPTLWA